ncbi:MAG TPA: hypothetical protein VJ742_10660 [Nitrososphaera sp.]|nr:hypothetical protein [Nitrososphaera sp.]
MTSRIGSMGRSMLGLACVNALGTTIDIPVSFDSDGTFTSIYAVAGTNSYLQLHTGSLKRAGEMTFSP